ncbi:10502_t:CDS:1 [Paraglomus occultum]|uniref:10502_t:CDS:1 n=1 Tax=Paraglomus occultum TaxID=144539 RepID=A0A9N9DA96_9GLOM|nr:10502_t:CDS:1 [Paraglomus occultum]
MSGGRAKGGVSLKQFEFEHFLMKYYEPERLKEILISATHNKVNLTSEKGGYGWYFETPDDTSDDYLLPEGDTNTSLFGFLLGARINKEEEVEIEPKEPGGKKQKTRYSY